MSPYELPVLGPSGSYRPRGTLTVPDVTGTPFAQLSLAPKLYVQRAMAALRSARPLPLDERIDAIARAGEEFATGVVDGIGVEEYEHAVARVGGIPIGTVRVATENAAVRLAHIHRTVLRARPAGAVSDWRDPLTRAGRAVWTRRGEVFAVHASGTHPGAHSLWPEALAMGYRVAVRPNRHEPFTAYRMVAALRAAGFPDDQVVALPTEHAAAEAILDGADLAYGGDDVIRQYADDPTIITQQPGRSKILLTEDADWRQYVELIVASVSGHAGSGCVNTTAVLVQGDPAPLAQAVADRLALLPSLPPEDTKAVLPVQRTDAARALQRFLAAKADGATALLGGEGIVEELGDGSAVLRPAVHLLPRFDDRAGVELPFPCVWFAPWHGDLDDLQDSLVLTAITEDEALIDTLLAEPSIGNLYLGNSPTHLTAPGLPHDGYLADVLMRTKSVMRG